MLSVLFAIHCVTKVFGLNPMYLPWQPTLWQPKNGSVFRQEFHVAYLAESLVQIKLFLYIQNLIIDHYFCVTSFVHSKK
jgi:hypothetical protein